MLTRWSKAQRTWIEEIFPQGHAPGIDHGPLQVLLVERMMLGDRPPVVADHAVRFLGRVPEPREAKQLAEDAS